MSELKRREVLGWLALGPAAGALAACGTSGQGTMGQVFDASEVDGAAVDGSTAPEPGADAALRADAELGRDAGVEPDAASEADAALEADAAESCEPTTPDAQGPFFEPGAPERVELAPEGEPGELLRIEGRVVDADCRPLAGALLDVWQADAEGEYHEAGADWRLRAQLRSDAEGRYAFDTIMPGRYPLGGSTRPAHIHFTVSHPGHRPVTTQLYFAGDPFLAPNDPCNAGCDSGDPARIIELNDVDGRAAGFFEIVLGAG